MTMPAMRISLRKQLVRLHASRRQAKAAGFLRSFIARHQKVDEGMVRLDKGLNQQLSIKVSRNIEPIDVDIEKVGGEVMVKPVKPVQAQQQGNGEGKKAEKQRKEEPKEKEAAKQQAAKPQKAPDEKKAENQKREQKGKAGQSKT